MRRTTTEAETSGGGAPPRGPGAPPPGSGGEGEAQSRSDGAAPADQDDSGSSPDASAATREPAPAAPPVEGRGDGSVPSSVGEAVTAVGEFTDGPLMLLPALALGLLAAAVAAPALRRGGQVAFQLAEHRVETAVLALSLLVAWALAAML